MRCDAETFQAPTVAEIVDVLRKHPLVKLREKVLRGFLVGSFARGCSHAESDIDILLEVAPHDDMSSSDLENHYRQALMAYFVRNDIKGNDDSVHPQWQGRRVDLYFTYDAELELRPKIALQQPVKRARPGR